MTTIKESPRRVQRRRTKGWRMPENTVYVGRPSKWGNPNDWKEYSEWYPEADPEELRRMAASDFKHFTLDPVIVPKPRPTPGYASVDEIRTVLAGKNLACWCPPDQPCHADALLEIANTQDWMTAGTEVLYWPGVRSEHYAPRNGTVLQDGVAIFGGTACVRIRKQDGGTDFIQLSHIEPQP